MAAKQTWRNYEAQEATRASDIRVGIAASFTARNLVPFLGAGLLSAGLEPDIQVGAYGQLHQVCVTPRDYFGEHCQVIALLWRAEDLMRDDILALLNGEVDGMASAAQKAASLSSAIATLRRNFPGMIIVGVPPLPTGMPAGPLSLDNARALGAFHRAIVGNFLDALSPIDGVNVLDLDAVQRQVGFAASFDSRQWYLYRQPFTDAYLFELAALLSRTIVAARRSPKKCVVLDCDNTLWGGIVGEDGLDGIQLGEEFPGRAYRDLQRLLLYWRRQGVLLALATKNNEADVWEVFDRHDAMLLKREHLAAWQINWEPKAVNIARIAEALNIGLDALVFIDDNAMEIDHMRKARPEVTSILLPEDPAEIPTVLQSLALFDRLGVTQEDRQRSDMMRAERDRQVLNAAMTQEEFLRALDLRFDLFRARPAELGRIAQLVNKTNQFNLTTIRRTLEDVRLLADSADHRIYGLRVMDKFGDYGLTGVVIAEISTDRRVWTIDTLLLSCRVLGRGVESCLIAALAQEARAAGAVEFIASFMPTSKNGLAAKFLPDHGFTQEEPPRWRLRLTDAPVVPDYVRRLSMNEPAAMEVA